MNNKIKALLVLGTLFDCETIRNRIESAEVTNLPSIDYSSPIYQFQQQQKLEEQLQLLRKSNLGNRHSRRWGVAIKRRNNKR